MLDPEYVLPDGFNPPLARVTPRDHSAWIYVAALLGMCCSLVFCAIRALVRSMIAGGFGTDDYVFYAAAGCAIVQTGIVLGACSRGLGKTFDLLSLEEQAQVQQMWYASNLFLIIALGLAKMSVIAFLHRISRMKSHRITFNIATGVVAAWSVGAIFALALQCDFSKPWIAAGASCSGTVSPFSPSHISRAHITRLSDGRLSMLLIWLPKFPWSAWLYSSSMHYKRLIPAS